MRIRELPLAWYGNAQEVRVMGSWDDWSTGVELSPSSIPDQVFTKFEGVLRLRPGKHFLKFLVDGEWRPAPDWDTEVDAMGEYNNVVTVF